MALPYFLQAWLQNVAREKIERAVMDAAKKKLAEAGEAQPSDAPCHAGVVFALGVESGGLEDLLDGVVTTRGHGFVARQGKWKDRPVVAILSGPGKANAAKAAEALIDGHHPQRLISAGFAGGLDPALKRCDILVADELADASGGRMPLDLAGVPEPLRTARGVRIGRLLTVDHVVRLPSEKASLLRQHGAAAVDMETFAVAEVCRRREVPFLAVRAINDTAADELPKDVERLLNQKSTAARWGAALGAVINRPGSFKDLYQLKENAILASDRLGKFLAEIIG